MRYRFYRVHKFVCFKLAAFDQLTAQTDFLSTTAIDKLTQSFEELMQMLISHAEFEDLAIHQLLRDKNLTEHDSIEAEHKQHLTQFATLKNKLSQAIQAQAPEDKQQFGYEFYLMYRLFYSETLKHLYDEEMHLMPKLQELYSDEELAAVQANTYAKMNVEHIVGMISVLIPYTNIEDQIFFLKEIKQAEPQKFELAWDQIKPLLPEASLKRIMESMAFHI